MRFCVILSNYGAKITQKVDGIRTLNRIKPEEEVVWQIRSLAD